MARRRSITLDQESRVLSLYKVGMAIKEIMKETDIKSEQTIYRILDSNGVSRRPKVNGVKRILVMIEEDMAATMKYTYHLWSRYHITNIRKWKNHWLQNQTWLLIFMPTKKRLLDKGFNIGMSYEGIEEMRNKYLK